MAIITLNNNSLSSVTALPAGVGGSLVKLHSTTLSSAASSVSIDGYFTSDYDIYKIIVYDYEHVNDNVAAFWRANIGGVSQTSTIYSSSGYGTKTTTSNTPTIAGIGTYNSYGQQYFTWQQAQNTGTSLTSTAAEITIFNPLQTSKFKDIHYRVSYEGNNDPIITETFGCKVRTTSALSGLTFLASSGNIETGTFTLYGVNK